MFKQKPRKVEVKKVPEHIEMKPSGGEVKVNRPLVEAMKVRLEHEMGDSQETQLAKLLKLTVEVRGGGVAGPFEATLTEVGARAILDCLK